MELSSIFAISTPTSPISARKIAFIGSGPLPLTSLYLCRLLPSFPPLSSRALSLAQEDGEEEDDDDGGKEERQGVEILNIDHSLPALILSQALISSLSPFCTSNSPTSPTKPLSTLTHQMKFLHASATSPSLDLMDFDIVYLAALVGPTQREKEAALLNVVGKMREGAVVVLRSAWGLRRLLYAVCSHPITLSLSPAPHFHLKIS